MGSALSGHHVEDLHAKAALQQPLALKRAKVDSADLTL